MLIHLYLRCLIVCLETYVRLDNSMNYFFLKTLIK